MSVGIFPVLIFIIACYSLYAITEELFEKIIGTILIVIISIFLFAAGTAFFESVFTTEDYIGTNTECVWNIKSTKPVDQVSGRFTLGSGTIQTTDYFYILIDNNDGSYTKWKIPTNMTRIVEANVAPNLARYNKVYRPKYMKILWGANFDHTEDYYILTVPKGTIIEQYQIM